MDNMWDILGGADYTRWGDISAAVDSAITTYDMDLRDQLDDLITVIDFEVPAMMDDVDLESRGRILLKCANEAKHLR